MNAIQPVQCSLGKKLPWICPKTARVPTSLDNRDGNEAPALHNRPGIHSGHRAHGLLPGICRYGIAWLSRKGDAAALASYTYRWTRPEGTMDRVTLGRWPQMNRGEARDAARRETEMLDRKATR